METGPIPAGLRVVPVTSECARPRCWKVPDSCRIYRELACFCTARSPPGENCTSFLLTALTRPPNNPMLKMVLNRPRWTSGT